MPSNSLQKFTDKLFDLNWNKNNAFLLLFLSGALAILLFGINVKAQWWVVDDHEIVYFLGNDHVLHADEIWGKLLHDTEIGQYLRAPRFRPVYYSIRLLECWAWGANPGAWYAFRIFAFGLFVSLFCYLISQKVGGIIGGFISLNVFVQTYWVDIISRLGPSEFYAVIGLAFFGWGVYEIYRSNKITGWWCVFAGVVICSGAKENFLFMILPVLYIGWDFYKNKKLDFIRCVLAIGACVWMAWIGFTIVISTSLYGGDVYNNSIGIRDRLFILIRLFERNDVLELLSICALWFLVTRYVQLKRPELLEVSRQAVVLSILLTLIYISQIFFYNGVWPVGTRYDFPGILVGPLMLVVFISFLRTITLTSGFTQFRSSLILLSIVGSILLVFSQVDNISEIRSISRINVEKTVAFSQRMKQLADLGIQNPDHVLIIQTDNSVWDYEPVFSYFRFLRFYGLKNRISFLWAGQKPESYSNGLRSSLARDLRDLSFYGKLPFMVAGNGHDFTPFSEIDNSESKCILVLISGQPKKNCPIIVASNWR